ncbi:sigma-54-dependent Fis family transcriptional regulator [bacterium]|nr:sigma-54-dependent Fis family transcriptional regulator [bacterium]
MAQVLLVDDEKNIRITLSAFLKKLGNDVDDAASGAEAEDKIKACHYDLIITDLKMRDKDGLDVLQTAKNANPLTEVIVLTGFGTVESGVEAMKLGAYDYLTKPPDMEEFKILVTKALERRNLRTEVQQLQDELKEKYKFENIIGRSNEMLQVLSVVTKVAPTDSTVLITGESGTGKELIARALHLHSRRKNRAFVTINCGALPENLQESELFGHARGAFTGAIKEKRGLFQEANGGTLFLDEIGETALSTQVKLLRFLQNGEIRRVGETDPLNVDVRMLAATNRILEDAIKDGEFREDLFYRLNVIPIHVPPLRERRDDIPLLVNHFMPKIAERNRKKIESVTPEAMKLLTGWNWPGNVRELENVLERAIILCNQNVIMPRDLPPSMHKQADTPKIEPVQDVAYVERTLDDLEKDMILKTLERYHWNQKKTSDILGISTTTLWRKLKGYGIDPRNRDME